MRCCAGGWRWEDCTGFQCESPCVEERACPLRRAERCDFEVAALALRLMDV